MIHVRLHVYTHNRRSVYEETIEKGPYVRLLRGYGGEINGETPDGDLETVFEATVGIGGSCSTCAYDYPDFGYTDSKRGKLEVKDFEIYWERGCDE